MKIISLITGTLLLVFGVVDSSEARSKRVNQIPNGGKFSCANCHIDPNGGGARNPFGIAVENGYLDSNGDVVWNSSLAGLDSDGDGVSNGAELQDPNGVWVAGQPQPGDVNLVSNPGDAGSTTDVAELNMNSLPNNYKIMQNYPNPFPAGSGSLSGGRPQTEIRFFLPKSEYVRLEVFNVLGRKVKTLVEKQISAGAYSIVWDGTNDMGEDVQSGLYIYRIESGRFVDSKRMVLIR